MRSLVDCNSQLSLVDSVAASMLFVQILLIGWVEGKRWADLKNPGSQGDGSFLGVTDELKGQSNGYSSKTSASCQIPRRFSPSMELNGQLERVVTSTDSRNHCALPVIEESKVRVEGVCRYPGGRWFDPFGLSRGNPKKLDEYKTKEIKNGRLAILVGVCTNERFDDINVTLNFGWPLIIDIHGLRGSGTGGKFLRTECHLAAG